jgi:hypothetical protein
MAPTGVDCHAAARWLMTPLAASPASFQPSNPAMTAGELSFPMLSSSIWDHLPEFLRAQGYVHNRVLRVTWVGRGEAAASLVMATAS